MMIWLKSNHPNNADKKRLHNGRCEQLSVDEIEVIKAWDRKKPNLIKEIKKFLKKMVS